MATLSKNAFMVVAAALLIASVGPVTAVDTYNRTAGQNISNSSDVSVLPDDSVANGIRDSFTSKDTSTWTASGNATYQASQDRWALVKKSSDGTKTIGSLAATRQIGNEDLYMRTQAVMQTGEASTDMAVRFWFMADQVNAGSIPSSDNGYRVEFTRGGGTVNIYKRSAGSWTKLGESTISLSTHMTVAVRYDKSAGTITAYKVKAGEHEQVLEVTGVSGQSYNNAYITGYKGTNNNQATVAIYDATIKHADWTGTVTSTRQTPQVNDMESVTFQGGSIWNDWQIQENGVLNAQDGDKHADPAVMVEPGRTYPYHMLARDSDSGSVDLWRSTDGENWELQKENAVPSLANAITKTPNGTYVVYYQDAGNGVGAMSASSLDGSWTDHGVILSGKYDPGVYYDESTGYYHLYYENNQVDGDPGGTELGHARSTDPVSGFTHLGVEWDTSGTSYKIGDPEIMKVGDKYHLFIDKDRSHPEYGILHLTSDSLGGWTRGDSFALTPNESTTANYGTGDASVRYYNGQFYMYFESWSAADSNWRVGYATSPGPLASGNVQAKAEVDTTGDGALDTTVGPVNLQRGYDMGQRQRDITVSNPAGISFANVSTVSEYQLIYDIQSPNKATRNDESIGSWQEVGEVYTASGQVTNAGNGTAISDATVEIYNQNDVGGSLVASTTTDSNGQWSLNLANGTYTAVADKNNYQSNQTDFTIDGGDATGVDIALRLEAGGTLQVNNPKPTGAQENKPSSLQADIEHAEFDEGTTATVTFYFNGTQIKQAGISTNRTVYAELPDGSVKAGPNDWSVSVTDSKGRVVSNSYTFSTASTLYIRKEGSPGSLITNTTNVRLVEMGGVSPTIIDRSVSDGTVDLSGIDLDSQYLVFANSTEYYDTNLVMPSVYAQASVYMMSKSTTSVESRFTLDDPTGEFPPGSVLRIQRPLERNGTVKYRTVYSDQFGVEGVTADVKNGQRYRIVVASPDGQVQIIGPYRADVSESIAVRPGAPGVELSGYEKGWASNADQTNRTLEWRYDDPTNKTNSLTVWIHEKGNESNQLVPNQSFYELGSVSAKESLTANESEKEWAVAFVLDRDGDGKGQFVTTARTTPDYNLVPNSLANGWRLIIGVGSLLLVAGLFSRLNVAVGAVTTSMVGGVLWYIGLLGGATTGAGVTIAMFFSIAYYMTTRGR